MLSGCLVNVCKDDVIITDREEEEEEEDIFYIEVHYSHVVKKCYHDVSEARSSLDTSRRLYP